jgi:hypothetical protein
MHNTDEKGISVLMIQDIKNQVLRGNNLYLSSWCSFKGIVRLPYWRKIIRMIFSKIPYQTEYGG